jgi:hypothetical protein
MTFDPSITLGALLNAGVLLVGFVGAFVRIGGRIDLLTHRMASSEKAIESMASALKSASDADKRLATLEERISNHVKMLTIAQRDISDLRRGEGFISGHRKSVDGEYP